MKGGRREEGERVCRCDTDMLSRCHPEEALSINFSLSLSPPNPEMLRSYALFRSEYQSFFKKKIASQIHHKNNKKQFFFTPHVASSCKEFLEGLSSDFLLFYKQIDLKVNEKN